MSRALLLCLAIPALGIRMHDKASPQDFLVGTSDAEGPKNPTLREWMQKGPVHAALAPIRCAMVLHFSILQTLRENNLHQNIVSLSGSSTGGLAAGIWSSVDWGNSKQRFAHIFGTNLSQADCFPHCDKYQTYYLNYLDSPVNSESDGFHAMYTQDEISAYGKHFFEPWGKDDKWRPVSSDPVPLKESYMSYVQSMLWIDIMKTAENFADTQLPVVISGLMISPTLNSTILMNKGNLHIALIGTTSPPGNTKPVWVSQNHYVTDGYFGDEHGARGWDVIEDNQRPNRVLNIVLVDAPFQSELMNWTKLAHHRELEEVTSIFMAVGQPLLYQISNHLKNQNVPFYMTYRDVMLGTKAVVTRALDKPLDQQKGAYDYMTSYYKHMDIVHDIPPHVPKWFTDTLQASADSFVAYRAELTKKTKEGGGEVNITYERDSIQGEVVEAEDKMDMLHTFGFQLYYQNFKKALDLTMSGSQYTALTPEKHSLMLADLREKEAKFAVMEKSSKVGGAI